MVYIVKHMDRILILPNWDIKNYDVSIYFWVFFYENILLKLMHVMNNPSEELDEASTLLDFLHRRKLSVCNSYQEVMMPSKLPER